MLFRSNPEKEPEEWGVILGAISRELRTHPGRWTKVAAGIRGVSEETTTGVHRLYELAKNGEALAMIERGTLTGGAARNAAYLDAMVAWGAATDAMRAVLVDPQTSGGLLVALRPEQVDGFVAAVPGAVVVAEAEASGARPIVVA